MRDRAHAGRARLDLARRLRRARRRAGRHAAAEDPRGPVLDDGPGAAAGARQQDRVGRPARHRRVPRLRHRAGDALLGAGRQPLRRRERGELAELLGRHAAGVPRPRRGRGRRDPRRRPRRAGARLRAEQRLVRRRCGTAPARRGTRRRRRGGVEHLLRAADRDARTQHRRGRRRRGARGAARARAGGAQHRAPRARRPRWRTTAWSTSARCTSTRPGAACPSCSSCCGPPLPTTCRSSCGRSACSGGGRRYRSTRRPTRRCRPARRCSRRARRSWSGSRWRSTRPGATRTSRGRACWSPRARCVPPASATPSSPRRRATPSRSRSPPTTSSASCLERPEGSTAFVWSLDGDVEAQNAGSEVRLTTAPSRVEVEGSVEDFVAGLP